MTTRIPKMIVGIGLIWLAAANAFANQAAEAILRPRIAYTESAKEPFKTAIEEEKIGEPLEMESLVQARPEFKPPALVVEGVIWGSQVPCVIINHTVLKEGDVIEGAKIMEIKKEGIKLFYQGWKYYVGSPANSGLEQNPVYQGGYNE